MKQSYEWVLSCINSCNDPWQLECCDTLMDLCRKQFPDVSKENMDLEVMLIDAYERKQTSLII